MSGADEDVLQFTPTSLGLNTPGTLSRFFDGSDVGLGNGNAEDVDALGLTQDGDLLLSTNGNFSAQTLTGVDEDAFTFTPTTTGANTSGTFGDAPFFDGSDFGLANNDISGVDFNFGGLS